MATNRNSEHLRYRYGICLNDNCSKCKNKEVQQVSTRKDFVCEECGKPLRECPPPKSGPNKMVIAAIAVFGTIIICIGIFFGLSGSDNSESITAANDSVDIQKKSTPASKGTDTITVVKTDTVIVKEQIPTKDKSAASSQLPVPAKSNGTLRLSYGKYTGAIKNGYPHGQGKLTYTTSRQINRNDIKGRSANAGDYVIGEFFNGYVVYGKHYDSAGNLLESLNFGVGLEDSYESK